MGVINIETNLVIGTQLFRDLVTGETFRWEGDLYLKVEANKAFKLDGMYNVSYKGSESVRPVSSKLVVEG